jgi:FKBP-type peptidyl-prolyl cis-trans isomerase SlpA
VNRIQPGSFLTLHYRLAGPDGDDLINTFGSKPATLSLGTGQLAPALEEHLIGLAEGDRRRFELPAGAAFGPRNAELVQRVSNALLQKVQKVGKPGADYALGDVLQFPAPDGVGSYSGVVSGHGDGWVLVDFNHPLAGREVHFEVEVLGVLE